MADSVIFMMEQCMYAVQIVSLNSIFYMRIFFTLAFRVKNHNLREQQILCMYIIRLTLGSLFKDIVSLHSVVFSC